MKSRSVPVVLAILAIGISLLAGSAVAVPGVDDDVDCDDETEVVIAQNGEEVLETRNVSTAWEQNNEYVSEVREEFEQEYPLTEMEWVRSIGITSIDEPVCDRNQSAISLGVTDVERAQDEFGETYKDIPLVIKERGGQSLDGSAGDAMENNQDRSNEDDDDSEASTMNEDADPEEEPLPGFGIAMALGGVVGALLFRRLR